MSSDVLCIHRYSHCHRWQNPIVVHQSVDTGMMHLPCTGILYTAHVCIQYVDSHKGVFLHNKRKLAQRVPILLLTCQRHSRGKDILTATETRSE